MAKKQDVQAMFNDIAPKYDLINHLTSMQIDKLWRRKAMSYIQPTPQMCLLDVACGTGDFSLAANKRGVMQVVGIDISQEMVEVGRRKVADRGLAEAIDLQVGDSEAIAFPDDTFDVATVAFGVRNFENLELGLTDMLRVLRSGGRVIILEFSMPRVFPVKQLYQFYFRSILPLIGGWVSGNRRAYDYLPDSVMKFPQDRAFMEIMERCGYVHVRQNRLSFGIATIYIGEKA